MRRESEQEMNDLYDKSNHVIKLMKFLKKEGQDVNGGRLFERNKWQTYVQRKGSRESAKGTYGKDNE